MSAFEKVSTFLGEVKAETKKINWPSLESLKGSTRVVIVTVFIITVFVSILDLAIGRFVNLIMHAGSG